MIRLESLHQVSFPREKVWPVLSKTDWLNRSLGLPPVTYEFAARAEGGSWVTAGAQIFGRQMRWRELPFEWMEPCYYHVRRVFESGPFREAVGGIELRPLPGNTTGVVVWCELTPRGALGKWFARRLLGPKTKRDMERVMAHLQESLAGRTPVVLPRLPTHPVHEAALQSGLSKLRTAGPPADLVERLEQWLRESPDVELSHIRPFALARNWGRDPWLVFRLFLQATRAGLLDLSWEILCPNCRSARETPAHSLVQLKRASHCEVCQIKFDAEFDKSVELKFAVNPAVRPPDLQTFCLAGPGGKSHIVGQLWLEPGEERRWQLPGPARPLRLQSPQVKRPLDLGPEDAPAPGWDLVISCGPDHFAARRERSEKENGSVRMANPNPFPMLLSLGRVEWDEDILTAACATNWQEFRDLFAHEVISPEEQVTVGSQIILFTDLRGSTALYHDVGDAPAYALVRNHFSVLTAAVREHHGTVVKTMGDAVMAVFSRVDEALETVRQMHRELPALNSGGGPQLALKSGLHLGPCLAVNANGRLDFFGTTINLAARIVECCRGGDLTVSDEFFHRPETAQFLRERGAASEALEIRFRGFDTPHRVWRIGMV